MEWCDKRSEPSDIGFDVAANLLSETRVPRVLMLRDDSIGSLAA
jgi:hypothetical protein